MNAKESVVTITEIPFRNMVAEYQEQPLWEGAKVNVEKISAGLDKGFLDATALAEYLVKKGVAFRTAHGIVGTLVAQCEKDGKGLAQISIEQFKKYSNVIGEDVYLCLGSKNVAASYATAAAASPAQGIEQVNYWKKQLATGE